MTSKKSPQTIDEYINSFPEDIQVVLQNLRKTIRDAAPEAAEAMGYGVPAFKLNNKPLIYYAAFKNHIGFYPAPAGIKKFEKSLTPYIKGKGTLQFPLDKPIPYDLVRKIVRFRAEQQ